MTRAVRTVRTEHQSLAAYAGLVVTPRPPVAQPPFADRVAILVSGWRGAARVLATVIGGAPALGVLSHFTAVPWPLMLMILLAIAGTAGLHLRGRRDTLSAADRRRATTAALSGRTTGVRELDDYAIDLLALRSGAVERSIGTVLVAIIAALPIGAALWSSLAWLCCLPAAGSALLVLFAFERVDSAFNIAALERDRPELDRSVSFAR
jgi:hypothetical protein